MTTTLVAGAMRWGSWGARFSTEQYQHMIEGCLNAGVQWFDHADIYGHHSTEAEFGAAIKAMQLSRSDYQLISKAGIVMADAPGNASGVKHYNYHSHYLLGQLDASLRHLHTDHLDLWLLHRPSPLMQVETIAEVLQQALGSGKAKAVGVSNFSPLELATLHHFVPLAYHQFECSLLHTLPLEQGHFHQCHQLAVLPQLWSPLGGGPGDVVNRFPALAPLLERLGKERGWDSGDALLAFVAAIPYAKQLVVGTSSVPRLLRMQQVLAEEPLALADWFALYEAVRGKEVA